MRVAILGAGPAGLFAAHAAVQHGHDVHIWSKGDADGTGATPRKSHMRGAQYLHRPIPGLSGEPFMLDYRLEGDIAGYKAKVYGDMSDVHVSPESLVGEAEAWDIREAYDKAWELYGSSVMPLDLAVPEAGEVLEAMIAEYDLVISTVPAKLLCYDFTHEFLSTKIWSTDYVKPIGAFERPRVDNLVVCSGLVDDWWYRQSRIQGWENTEFPENRKPNGKVWGVIKPVRTTCDCYPEITRMGRYGEWKKGVLSHESYYDTVVMLNNKH